MNTLKIHLFGKFSIQRENIILSGLDAQKVQELFCFLLTYRDRPHRRETLATMLWGEFSTKQSRKNLRQGFWMLQSALRAVAKASEPPLLTADDDWVQVNPEADFWLDTSLFEQAYQRTHTISAYNLEEPQAEEIHAAVNLHNNGFLPSYYMDWTVLERQRYQLMCIRLLSKLMSFCELRGQYEAGLEYGNHALHLEPASEFVHAQLMRLLFLLGDRTGALRQYDHCRSTLRQELGVEPCQQTQTLAEQIRHDNLNLPLIDQTSPQMMVDENPSSLNELLNCLNNFNHTLSAIQGQLHTQIREIEHLMKNKRE
jgi:DNA-binding SARP family transcriptional activator